MEQDEKAESGMQKNVISVIVLLIALVLLIYAAPKLQEILRERETVGLSEGGEVKETLEQAQVPAELVDWLPLITSQLPSHEDGSAKYHLRHMLLNKDGSELLLDLKEGEQGRPFDLILKRDQFGRYISDKSGIPMRLYPPKGE